MSMDVYIEATPVETRIWCVEGGELVEFRSRGVGEAQHLGAVFAGRVENVLPGIQAAFVDIGLERKAFLPVDGVACGKPGDPVNKRLRPGQMVLVQAAKEPGGSKGIKLSMFINLPSRNIVLMPVHGARGISKRITDKEQRERLASLMERSLPGDMGAIMRTCAQECTDGELEQELDGLLDRAGKLSRAAEHAAEPCLLESQDVLSEFVVDNLLREGVTVHIDSREQYEAVRAYAALVCPDYAENIIQTGLFEYKAHELDRRLRKLLSRRLWLKSGGNIVVDKTEALLIIDVNSAKHTGNGKGMRDTILRTNIEAAREARRQLRLRDIEGMVLIDFIHMDDEGDRRIVMDEFISAQRSERARVEALGFTSMGLMEVQRSRQARHSFGSGSRQICCPYCGGAGHVNTSDNAALDAIASALRLLRAGAEARVEIELHPEAASRAEELLAGAGIGDAASRITINPCGKHISHTKVRLAVASGEDEPNPS